VLTESGMVGGMIGSRNLGKLIYARLAFVLTESGMVGGMIGSRNLGKLIYARLAFVLTESGMVGGMIGSRNLGKLIYAILFPILEEIGSAAKTSPMIIRRNASFFILYLFFFEIILWVNTNLYEASVIPTFIVIEQHLY